MTNKEGVVHPEAGGVEQTEIHHEGDSNASFLRAARAGNIEKILEYLKGSIDINGSNANGLNALHLAAKEGHLKVVIELLKRGANPNAATKKGNTALHIASLAGHEETAKALVRGGADANMQSQNGFTPLYMAAQENHDNVIKFLLANGANQNIATEDGFTPLAVALQQGHDKVVAVLLENDAKGRVRLPALHIAAKKDDTKAAALLLQNDHDPDVTSKSGFTPLHIAAHYGNENIASLLLEKNANVNYSAKHQITPLHVAAKWGKGNMVTLLIDKGAKIDASTRDGLTPLHCAARSGHDQVVDLLLEKGAPITAKTKNGLAPLHMASQGDHVESARIVLSHKAPVDDVTVDYLTALHVAAHCGHVRVAKLLLDRKADPNARALNGFTPLHIACKKNRSKVVELLLKHGASIEATTESGLTPLHVASFMGCMNIVIFLLQHGANPDVPTVRGETPLHLAARANQSDIIRILLRNGAHVDASAREHQTPLHIAARLGNVDIVGLLLQHGAAVDATTKDMYTALHIAAKEGQEEVASVLLDHGASHAATTKKGFTPLHLAAKYGNINVAQLLIQKEAPVDAQGKNGVTPLHVAAHYDHVNVALLLLDKGAHPHATAKNGYTPLHIAAKKNQMDIATTLLEYGAKPSAESKAGFTPIHLASQEGHTDMTTLLIEHHADVNAPAKNGLTPLHLCSQEDKVNVAAVLTKNGARVDPPTKAGYTPLHVACHFGQINMIRFLLQHGADVNSTTSHGYTPLHQAAQQGHTLIINLLLEHKASPNTTTNQGQTALSIAQRLGYISVVETLKIVTETIVTTTTTTITEEKYKVVAPETMQETFMSDSEDEGGEDAMLGGDQTLHYMTTDELKALGDDNTLGFDVTHDERADSTLQAPLTAEEDHLTPQHVVNQESMFSSSMAPDNVDLARAPVHAGFLVSFMVDARGGAMRGCRHSGVRVIIPPRKAAMPMRITCRYLRKEKLACPPPLMDGEACASRILEVGPSGAKFLGPVIIEVPHFASLRGREREIVIFRSDNGESWREHTLEASEDAVNDVFNESFEDLTKLDDLNSSNRITRILTTDFPQYFAIVSRIRQEVHAIGPEGGMVSSTVVPQVQAIFPPGALTKKIKVGLQAQPITPELVSKLLGNRVAVSPIVTVEPRRRKFHKGITLTIPVPQAATKGMINTYSGDAPTLRLLCSITGGTTRAQWEDVTGSTPLTFVNDCVSFTTTVSARFWLIDCRQVNEATKFATELYREAVHVPFMAKFVVFAKRRDPLEAQLRVFCMTDDKEDKTLESQEHFTEVAKSRDVEVLEGKLQFLEFAGNLIPVTKSGEQLSFTFQAFRENRLPFTIRVKDTHGDPMGRVAFMREPRVGRGEVPQAPICNLNIVLPEADLSPVSELVTLEKKYGFVQESSLAKPELIHRADLRLSDIAKELRNDWIPLALQLDLPESDINSFRADHPDDTTQQGLAMLKHWLHRPGSKATGNHLEKGLRKINREDIVNQCMFNVELVTDDVEKAVAKVYLDQSGFDTFKEELGSSRDASLRRDTSMNGAYDEQDIMKEAESAAETSSESSDRDPHYGKHSERVTKRRVENISHSTPMGFEDTETLVQHVPTALSESYTQNTSNGADLSFQEGDGPQTHVRKKEFASWRYPSGSQTQSNKITHKNTPRYVKSNRQHRGHSNVEKKALPIMNPWTMTAPVSNKKRKLITRRNSWPPDSPRKLDPRKRYQYRLKDADFIEPFWTNTYEWLLMRRAPENFQRQAPIAGLSEFGTEKYSMTFPRVAQRPARSRVESPVSQRVKYNTIQLPALKCKDTVMIYFIKKANRRNSHQQKENYLMKLKERCCPENKIPVVVNFKPTNFIDTESTRHIMMTETSSYEKSYSHSLPLRKQEITAVRETYNPLSGPNSYDYGISSFQETYQPSEDHSRSSLRSIQPYRRDSFGDGLSYCTVSDLDNNFAFVKYKSLPKQVMWNKENIQNKTNDFTDMKIQEFSESKKSKTLPLTRKGPKVENYCSPKASKIPLPAANIQKKSPGVEKYFDKMPKNINIRNHQGLIRCTPIDTPSSTQPIPSSKSISPTSTHCTSTEPMAEHFSAADISQDPSSSSSQSQSSKPYLRQLFEQDIQSNFSKSTKKRELPHKKEKQKASVKTHLSKEKEYDPETRKSAIDTNVDTAVSTSPSVSKDPPATPPSSTLPSEVLGYSFLKSLIERVEQQEDIHQPIFPASVVGHAFLNALVEQQNIQHANESEIHNPSSVEKEADSEKHLQDKPLPASVIGQTFLKNLVEGQSQFQKVDFKPVQSPHLLHEDTETRAPQSEKIIPATVAGQAFLKTLVESQEFSPNVDKPIPASVLGQTFLKSLVNQSQEEKIGEVQTQRTTETIPASVLGQSFLKTLIQENVQVCGKADERAIPATAVGQAFLKTLLESQESGTDISQNIPKAVPSSVVGQAFLKSLIENTSEASPSVEPRRSDSPIPATVLGQSFLKSLIQDQTVIESQKGDSSLPASLLGQVFLKALLDENNDNTSSPIPAPVVGQAFLKTLINEQQMFPESIEEKPIPASVVGQAFLKTLVDQGEPTTSKLSCPKSIPSNVVGQSFLKSLVEQSQSSAVESSSESKSIPASVIGQAFLKSLAEQESSVATSHINPKSSDIDLISLEGEVDHKERTIPSSVINQTFLKSLIEQEAQSCVDKLPLQQQPTEILEPLPASVIGQAFLKTLMEHPPGDIDILKSESPSQPSGSNKPLPSNVIGQAFLSALLNLSSETFDSSSNDESSGSSSLFVKDINQQDQDLNGISPNHDSAPTSTAADLVLAQDADSVIIPPPPEFCTVSNEQSLTEKSETSPKTNDPSTIIGELLTCSKLIHSVMEQKAKDSTGQCSSMSTHEVSVLHEPRPKKDL